MNVLLILCLILVITIFMITIVCLYFVTKKKGKRTSKQTKQDEIEILIYQDEKEHPIHPASETEDKISDDTLNLDDLFKTMSIHVMKNDPDFDFGLRRSQNVKKD